MTTTTGSASSKVDHTPQSLEVEFSRCASLRWTDAERFTADRVPLMALIHSPLVEFDFVVRDRIVLDRHRGFEFERYCTRPQGSVAAFLFLARDEWGEPIDIVAWRDNQVARWLGRAGLLGAEQIDVPRLGEPLMTHADMREWLRAGRKGVVILDARQAAHALQHEHLLVQTTAQARELRSRLTIPAPRISAASDIRVAA